MTNKEKYQALCDVADIPLFLQYWWLEGVSAGKNWDVLLLTDEHDPEHIIAALPYEYDNHLRHAFIHPADLSPYGGLWFDASAIRQPEQFESLCIRLHALLAEKKIVSYRQPYMPGHPIPASLAPLGYAMIQRQTWVLEKIADPETVRNGFSKNKRRKLEKTAGLYQAVELEPEEFFRFCQLTSLQKKRRIAYTRELLLVLWEKASERGQIRLIGIRGTKDELLAAAMLVWDKQCVYQLINTFDHDQPDNGARELITLEAAKHAYRMKLDLDFCNPRDYLRHYGATKKSYPLVIRASRMFVLLHRLINWWQHL